MEKIKINPGNCVKLKSGIVALVTKDEKLVHIKTGEIVSNLKKYDDNFRNVPLNKVGENRFDIEVVYENIKLDNIIYIVNNSYNKDLIKSAYEFGTGYLVNWKNKLYFTNKLPTKTKNICDENDYFFQWEPFINVEDQGTIIINVDWCKSFLPFVKENHFVILEELLKKQKEE